METEVLVTGCFNVVHAGHVRLLEFASRYGKVTVGLNTDKYLLQKYGENTVSLKDRVYVLESIGYIDKVVSFSEKEPSALIRRLKPKYFVKGPDYTLEELPELPAAKSVGTHVIIHPSDKEYDSSSLIESLPKSAFKVLNEYS